jgi:hypothetical protein
MFYLFLLLIAFAGVAVYLAFFLREVPGAAAQRLGELEPLPPDLGRWVPDETSSEARAARDRGLKREVRVLYDAARERRLVRQVRYRKLDTNEIVEIEPEQVIKRRRLKA